MINNVLASTQFIYCTHVNTAICAFVSAFPVYSLCRPRYPFVEQSDKFCCEYYYSHMQYTELMYPAFDRWPSWIHCSMRTMVSIIAFRLSHEIAITLMRTYQVINYDSAVNLFGALHTVHGSVCTRAVWLYYTVYNNGNREQMCRRIHAFDSTRKLNCHYMPSSPLIRLFYITY